MTGEYKNMIKGIMAITAVMLLAAAALGRMAYYAGAGTAAFNLSLLFVTAQTLVILGAYILWYRKTSQEAEDMMNIVDKRRMAYHYKNKYILNIRSGDGRYRPGGGRLHAAEYSVRWHRSALLLYLGSDHVRGR